MKKDQFNGKGLPGDFDGMKKIKVTDIDNKPSNLDEWDVCMCPADLNYSGFPLGAATDLTASMLCGIDQENIIILQRWNRNHDDYCEEYEKEEEYCMIGW